jgi:hypothetical protein
MERPLIATEAEEKVGAVASIVTEVASKFEAFVFPAASATSPAPRRRINVPSDVHVTVIVTDVPFEEEGVKVEQVAVP